MSKNSKAKRDRKKKAVKRALNKVRDEQLCKASVGNGLSSHLS